jgi:hypothetical protein
MMSKKGSHMNRIGHRALWGTVGVLVVGVSIYQLSVWRTHPPTVESNRPLSPMNQSKNSAHSGWSLRTIVSNVMGRRMTDPSGAIAPQGEMPDAKVLGYVSADEIEVPNDTPISVAQPHFARIELDSESPDAPSTVNGDRPERVLARP